MNQEACQTFDQRLNEVMDLRLDPNADAQLRAHALLCNDCGELLDSFSELHTGLSGPNKIPISLLKSETEKSSDVKNAWINAIIIGALAALLFVGMNVGTNFDSGGFQVAINSNEETSGQSETTPQQPDFAVGSINRKSRMTLPAMIRKAPQSTSLSEVCTQIQSNEAIRYSEELPGFRPLVSTLDRCIEWLRVSIDDFSDVEAAADEEDSSERLTPSNDQGFLDRFVAVRV